MNYEYYKIFYFVGKVDFPPVVGSVISGGAAEQAGIKVKDRILTINGVKIENFAQKTINFLIE